MIDAAFFEQVIVRALHRQAFSEEYGNGEQEQRTVLIQRLRQQALRQQLVLDVGMRGVVFMLGMPAKILEVHEIRRFLPIEAHMVVNVTRAAKHQQEQGGVQYVTGSRHVSRTSDAVIDQVRAASIALLALAGEGHPVGVCR